MAKIPKSIRVEEKVYSYIQSYKGDGFNEKFENIILYAMESEDRLLSKIKQLDGQIQEKEKLLRKIMGEINRMQDIACRVRYIFKTCNEIEERLNMKSD